MACGGMRCVLGRAKAQVLALERQFQSSRAALLSQKQRWEGSKAAGEQIHVWAFPWVLPSTPGTGGNTNRQSPVQVDVISQTSLLKRP